MTRGARCATQDDHRGRFASLKFRPCRPRPLAVYIRNGYSRRMSLADPKDLHPLTPVVLHILLTLADGERHGYAIAQEIEETTDGQIRMGPGTLYGSIQRMLTASLIEEARQR